MDDRNRIPVPHKAMDELRRLCGVADPKASVDVVVSITRNGFLGVYPRPIFDQMRERLAAAESWDVESADLLATYEEYMEDQTLDQQNRFRVPTLHKDVLELDKEVVVVGQGDHLEVKTVARWKEDMRARLTGIRSLEEKVRRAGKPLQAPGTDEKP